MLQIHIYTNKGRTVDGRPEYITPSYRRYCWWRRHKKCTHSTFV